MRCHFVQDVNCAFYAVNAVFHRWWQGLEDNFYEHNIDYETFTVAIWNLDNQCSHREKYVLHIDKVLIVIEG